MKSLFMLLMHEQAFLMKLNSASIWGYEALHFYMDTAGSAAAVFRSLNIK